MVAHRKYEKPEKKPRPPAKTPEDRENQLINQAIDLAEQQLLHGTASSQVVVHYLKLGSSRESLEQERLRNENELLKAKIESMADMKKQEELYEEALNAMRAYAGHDTVEEEYEDD